jgi:hypothetical protein
MGQSRAKENQTYPATFFACFLTFAQRFFAALIIAALSSSGFCGRADAAQLMLQLA